MNAPLGITCHSWNHTRSQIVVSTNSFLLEIYEIRNDSWEKLHTLKEHHQLVSAVDWNPLTNRIISCSHDRNVVVWEFSTAWKPLLVNFYQTRGVLDASWSTLGNKFVVGTGSKNIGIGVWSDSLALWNTRRIKNFASSVTCVRFDPSGLIVAAGSTDGTCKVITAYMEEVDTNVGNSFRFSSVKTFGDILYTINANAWVNAVCWASDANCLVVTAHNGAVIFSDLQADQKVEWKQKPFMAIQFVAEGKVVAAGFDCRPVVFERGGSGWGEGKDVSSEETEKAGSSVQNRVKAMIKGFDGRKDRASIATKHKNTITCIRVVDATRYSTSDVTGSLHLWKI